MRKPANTRRVYIDGAWCVYCGAERQCSDHFPPRTSTSQWGYVLPSCMECNIIAGTTWPFNIVRRMEHVKSVLRKRGASAERLSWRGFAYLRRLGGSDVANVQPLIAKKRPPGRAPHKKAQALGFAGRPRGLGKPGGACCP